MKALTVVMFVLSCCATTLFAQEPRQVEKSGQHAELKLEEIVAGHLQELNGKYKLRVAQVTYEPGGHIGPHHHVGPGIRCVTQGELTYVKPEVTTVYRAGDCFFESGAVSHTAHNGGDVPVLLYNFLLLPADWEGGSAVPVPE